MAPFKLKFRMGGSRSTSQEHDPDPQVNEALLHHHNSAAIGASSSTIDSADCNSLGSQSTTNERKSLLPSNKSNNLRLGYLNPNISQCPIDSTGGSIAVPTTPPPSYEHVLEENTRLANTRVFDLSQQRQLSGDDNSQQSRRSSTNNLRLSTHLSSLEHLSLNNSQCTDPDCQENFANNENEKRLQRQQQVENFNENTGNGSESDDDNDDNRKESIDSTELLISTKMSIPSAQESQQHLLDDNCTEDCPQYSGHYTGAGACGGGASSSGNQNSDFFDPLINHDGYCADESHYNEGEYHGHTQNQIPPEYMERHCSGDTDNDDGWVLHQMSGSHHQQQHQQQQTSQYNMQNERALTPEIISNKSSKEIYKDLAKQWGITCKMSDGCRCMECQSHYFDCEFDDNEHQKTDGGLGAGTPMFISEVMHGSACNIL